MPTKPSVFRPIKANDVHQRPFKAYKSYRIDGTSLSDSYVTQSARYYGQRIDIENSNTGAGLTTMPYPTNPDGTNQYIAWKSLNHRFYNNGENNDYISEHRLSSNTEKVLFISASTLSIPYNDVGERIKRGTTIIQSTIGNETVNLIEDKSGNLRDSAILTSSFASSSRCVFYMSFNDTYRSITNGLHFSYDNDNVGSQYHYLGNGSGSGIEIPYKLNHQQKFATSTGSLGQIETGVRLVGEHSYYSGSSSGNVGPAAGLALKFTENSRGNVSFESSFIRVPHDITFNKFNRCDDWTISFWHCNRQQVGANRLGTILTKIGVRSELYNDGDSIKYRDIHIADVPKVSDENSFEKKRTPFAIGFKSSDGGKKTRYHFQASDGTNVMHLSTNEISASNADGTDNQHTWRHVAIQNSNSTCTIYIDGVTAEGHAGANTHPSGTLPAGTTANKADLLIGAPNNSGSRYATAAVVGTEKSQSIAEIRMYDYAVSTTGLASLANNHYKSASLFQSNVAGNVFNRNGQIVISSYLPKYHTGSGIFGIDHTWDASWRGTHTIYENQVMVRVPKDECNISVNPSATFTPLTDSDVACDSKQSNTLPGEFRKEMFLSGSAFPYITTIGLYNDKAQLLAVGKMAQPIQKRNDVDMNFIVRWDY